MEATDTHNAILERYYRAETSWFPLKVHFGQKLKPNATYIVIICVKKKLFASVLGIDQTAWAEAVEKCNEIKDEKQN